MNPGLVELVSAFRVKQTISYALRDPDFIAFLGRLSSPEVAGEGVAADVV